MRAVAPELDAPPLRRYGLPIYGSSTAPAAGAAFTEEMVGQWFTRFITISVRLVCDGNAANREVVAQYLDDAGNVYMQHGAATVVTASSTYDYYFSSFLDSTEFPVNTSILVPLTPILLPPTHSVKLAIVNVQAGDQLSRIRTWREQFYTDWTE